MDKLQSIAVVLFGVFLCILGVVGIVSMVGNDLNFFHPTKLLVMIGSIVAIIFGILIARREIKPIYEDRKMWR